MSNWLSSDCDECDGRGWLPVWNAELRTITGRWTACSECNHGAKDLTTEDFERQQVEEGEGMSEELKPCPFCGDDPLEVGTSDGGGELFCVYCDFTWVRPWGDWNRRHESAELESLRVEVAGLREKIAVARPSLESARRAINVLPESQLGYGMNTSTNIRWPLRDELISQIEKALAIIDKEASDET